MDSPHSRSQRSRQAPQAKLDRYPYLATVIACGLLTALLLPFHGHIDLVNTAMLLLLLVALVAFRLGRGPAILASVFNVAAFDIGFVPPRGSFTVHDAEYLIVFAVMLAVALIISHISGDLRDRRQAALSDELRQRQLYQLAAALNATLRREQVVAVVTEFLQRAFDATVHFHAPDDDNVEVQANVVATVPDVAVRSVLSSGQSAQINDGDAIRPVRNLQALKGATRLRGVLETRLPSIRPVDSVQRVDMLSTVAELMAAALERLHYLEVAARSQSEFEVERLRNSLLATLSHDLRTPLTVLYGRADALREAAMHIPALRDEAAAVCDEALRTNRLCESLLDLAQVRSATTLPRREWVALEEIVGAALSTLQGVPGIAQVRTAIPVDLPWLQLDALMFERVLANLIDNALKQGGVNQDVLVSAASDGDAVRLLVRNSGSRFPDDAHRLLDVFARGERTDTTAGFGIGLATCHAVVTAHGGTIAVRNHGDAAEVEIVLGLPTSPMPELPETSINAAAVDHD